MADRTEVGFGPKKFFEKLKGGRYLRPFLYFSKSRRTMGATEGPYENKKMRGKRSKRATRRAVLLCSFLYFWHFRTFLFQVSTRFESILLGVPESVNFLEANPLVSCFKSSFGFPSVYSVLHNKRLEDQISTRTISICNSCPFFYSKKFLLHHHVINLDLCH